MSQQVPSPGRIVLYVLKGGNREGEHRPAVIVRVWNDQMVNLLVFADGENDREYTKEDLVYWSGSKLNDESGAPGTWHWPEYVPPTPQIASPA